ncbi:lactamase [Candidatus Kuenenbacteria bacterium CG23_combo_of_CG06-09_8_20_14_all_36_9]|uniref:Lactamase n=1 Tax=Candidatus Kuenenbacteria bacterium CG10_big_fil_rev_8_21_14_0_10_36_11 TaxID=1974618 RepID=A0A2M6WAC3_9BACT|nr:MAG: lactamase [Candidatus Kuenenbacteria bacterium CG23_combo_of_CG06-09_8_20_14_all_36_9]PIT89762.1 MAG: lactamase [Candidatus Kuenenbacteria bacterium CG10_big_fil_rev_8_21_14_0_10_36_11]
MYIQWFGQSFFKITTKNSLGQELTLAIDPFNKNYGLKVPNKFGADIALITHDHEDHNNLEIIKGTEITPEPFVISGPGEYEVKGVMIYGVPSFHDDENGTKLGDNTIYIIEAENMWLAHLGDLGQKKLSEKQLEHLEGVDVLFVPIGGTYTIDAKIAGQIISEIEPKIIIPMHYKIPDLNIALDGVEKFIKEIGLKPEQTDKLRLVKKDLPAEETKLVILQP